MVKKLAFGVALLGMSAWTAALTAQGAAGGQNPSHVHMGHVSDKMNGTPDGQGLLPTAIAEAKIAVQHAALAAKTPDNLDAMKTHAGHVLHAVDPTQTNRGPGLGYGVKRAAAGVVTHIGLAAKAEGASQNVQTHAVHVGAAAEAVVKRCDAIVALVARIRAASTAEAAAPLVTELHTLATQLATGVDLNGDGRVGWNDPEGGLDQAQQHMDLMKKGEGGA